MPILKQPDHLLDDADSAIKKLGVERAQKGSYLFKSLLASNAQLTFGSDWPVGFLILFMHASCGYFKQNMFYGINMPFNLHNFRSQISLFVFVFFFLQVVDINPLGSIKTAMKRTPPGWESAWISSECLTLNDALNA